MNLAKLLVSFVLVVPGIGGSFPCNVRNIHPWNTLSRYRWGTWFQWNGKFWWLGCANYRYHSNTVCQTVVSGMRTSIPLWFRSIYIKWNRLHRMIVRRCRIQDCWKLCDICEQVPCAELNLSKLFQGWDAQHPQSHLHYCGCMASR
jgi:hypothetical protein